MHPKCFSYRHRTCGGAAVCGIRAETMPGPLLSRRKTQAWACPCYVRAEIPYRAMVRQDASGVEGVDGIYGCERSAVPLSAFRYYEYAKGDLRVEALRRNKRFNISANENTPSSFRQKKKHLGWTTAKPLVTCSHRRHSVLRSFIAFFYPFFELKA